MIQPVGRNKNRNGGENVIGFLNTDFEKLASEVKATNNKYNTPKEQRLNVSKQTAGSMYSQKNQHRIEFLDGNSVPAPAVKEAEKVDPVLPSKLPSNYSSYDPQNRLQNDKAVARLSSVGEGGVGEYGGPSRQIKSESAPSIWDSEKLVRMRAEIDAKTATQQEKAAQQEYRKTVRQQAHDKLVEALQNVDTRKASNVSSAADQTVSDDSARFGHTRRNLSIFDTMSGQTEFNSLPAKTAGEQLSAKKEEARSAKDESWRSGGRVMSSKDSMNRLFDIMMESSQKKEQK